MRDEHGIASLDGTAEADGQKLFMRRYLQARDPYLAGAFLAAFSAEAAWLTDLEPVPGMRLPEQSAAKEPGDGPQGRGIVT
jgi:hypothetical protein